MRPRRDNLHLNLQQCIYCKHGSYWLVKRGKWIRLCKDRAGIPAALDRIAKNLPPQDATMPGVAMHADDVTKFAIRRVLATKRASKLRRGGSGLEFTLTEQDAIDLLEASKWRCAVTGLAFNLANVGSGKQRPFAPSLDRKDSSLGYTKDNCRFVCVAANFAMGSWGETVLRDMAKSMRSKKLLDVSKVKPAETTPILEESTT